MMEGSDWWPGCCGCYQFPQKAQYVFYRESERMTCERSMTEGSDSGSVWTWGWCWRTCGWHRG